MRTALSRPPSRWASCAGQPKLWMGSGCGKTHGTACMGLLPHCMALCHLQDNIVTIAKYRAQSERLERELSELRAGRHALGGEAIPAEEAAAPAAGSTGAAGGGGRQPAQPAADSGAAADTAMADAAEQQAAGQQAQQPGGGGMWM